ncbi:hypothetical protein BCR36DRAFT_375743 [Piromyces finnis]|uniref:Uncharacterized protein n=1 Tax=Piromyces finnis TaxID=1754191 RepID=A0A1Y1UHI3_9FUNG|nr:hypothetical protein BCR36DRAFT_375743 [Piromyces finnis]|eukprot:ORX36545.1 hypothetical protein BCR36DRAFT_375743 [Piromyces finnis]
MYYNHVGYVCVQIDKINSFVQMLFFMYYFDSLYKINRSIWRTYLRLIRTIINSKFGSSMNDIFIKRVLGYFISQKLTYMTLPDRYKNTQRTDHLIKMFVGISIASFFFGSFDSNVKKLSFLFGIILVLIPVRFRNKVHRLIVKMKIFPKRKLENNDLHNKLKIGKQVNEAFKEYIISREKFIQYFYNQNNIKNIKKINDDPVENKQGKLFKNFCRKRK